MTSPSDMRPIALTMGDPAGCGPSIARAAWRRRTNRPGRPFFVVGRPDAFQDGGPIALIDHPSEAREAFATALPLMPAGPDIAAPVLGRPDPDSAGAVIAAIDTAVALARSGDAAAVVTNPISKALLYRAGFKHPGHTEHIAALCADPSSAPPRPVMMLVGGGLRVALATIHTPLAQAARAISGPDLEAIGRITHRALQTDFGVAAPRLAFAGLNPHAGEDGALGREEIEIVNPAAEALRAEGVDISDARPGDTVFHEALDGRFDTVIAMYHDQGLIPVKTLDFWGGVNVSLGLPIIRTSPDHGVAYDAAAAGTARADSLIAALDLADSVASARAAARV